MSQKSVTRQIWFILLAATVALGLYLRCSGTFRGLDVPYLYHPDEMKQVTALHNYLQGHYVWHTGSLFYDGYPYGLNHIDEWLLRPVLWLRNLILHTLFGTSSTPTIPEMPSMYYWARGLRIFYGMTVLLLVYLLAKRFFEKPGIRWLAITMTAIAPLSVCVSHFATGDIGVDLFGTLAIVMLCLYADTVHRRYLFLAGLATGMAFGCKYNGMLAGITIATYTTLQLLEEKRFKAFFSQCVTATSGCILGILISTPALILNFHQTHKDIIDNFTFIKNYDVDPAFAAKSFHIKAWLGLTQNTPIILQAFGLAVVMLAVIGLMMAIVKYLKTQSKEPTGHGMDRLAVAVYSFPFLALFISLAGKPNVQPFHFSYMQIPLVLCATSVIAWLWQHNLKWSYAAAALCSVIAIAELGVKVKTENYFWQREDNIVFTREMPEIIFNNVHDTGRHVIKDIYLESGGVSAFRNRKIQVKAPFDMSWNALQGLPVPTIPYPVDHEWIFANGPVFPRNDRMFIVHSNEIRHKNIVLHSRPGNICMGLRSSAWPVQATINIGNDRQELFLEPNDQKMLTFIPRKWRHCPDNDSDLESFIIPITVEAKNGNLVATLLDSDYEKEVYKVFGGTTTNYVNILPQPIDVDRLAECLNQTRYIETNYCNIRLTASKNRTTRLLLPQTGMFLPCGAYELECSVTGIAPTSTATFILTSPLGMSKQPGTRQDITVTQGSQRIIYRFAKPFAHYFCQIHVQCRNGKIDIGSWRLHPDIRALTTDLKAWRETNVPPPWAQRYTTQTAWSGQKSELHDVVFDNVILIKSLEYSSCLKRGDRLAVKPTISMTRLPYSDYDIASFFFHVLDQNGKQVAAFDLPLCDAINNTYADNFFPLTEALDLLPGTYELWIGAWNVRTHRRLAISGGRVSRQEGKKRRMRAGTITVTPP